MENHSDAPDFSSHSAGPSRFSTHDTNFAVIQEFVSPLLYMIAWGAFQWDKFCMYAYIREDR
jgi:hypothetical protein